MKRLLMLVTILMSVFMLSACEHYFPYYGGGDDGYGYGHDGGHGGGGYGEHEDGGHEGDD